MERDKSPAFPDDFFVQESFIDRLKKLGLNSIDDVFNFSQGRDLQKPNLAKHRDRIQIDLTKPPKTLFLKRYNHPPIWLQIKNWFSHKKRAATADFDRFPCEQLKKAGINTPEVIAHGFQWGGLFEKRSFIVTEKLQNAWPLEKKLPDFFYNSSPTENVKQKKDFINALADFAAKFHKTGYCHRDFYLAHIFTDDQQNFYLIDLQRTFKPLFFKWRFKLKDLAQLYYSSPGQIISRADRFRFYIRYTGRKKMTLLDKLFIKALKAKVWRMADHDIRHGRPVPFAQ
jgi:hypothetical protein